ncbi:MAG: M2 family metallopeptidase [Gaiellales bacterium]
MAGRRSAAGAMTLVEAEARLARLETEANLAWWEMSLDATEAASAAAEAASAAYEHALAEPGMAAAAVALDASPLEQRRAEVLRLLTAGRQRPPELIDRIVALETELMAAHSRYRAAIDGTELDAAAVDRVLAESVDPAEREAVWTSARGVGREVAAGLRELARLRNEAARAAGHRDHYAMALALDELDEARLYGLFDDLHAALAPAWAAERAAIEAERRAALGLAADAPFQPWHMVDVFGQDAPSVGPDPLEPVIGDVDALAASTRYFADLGHDVTGVIDRSDVRPRAGKDQHAFMMHVDRRGDIRVLLNLVPTVRWLDTTLHELGHAIYELSIDVDLPWLLRDPAHILTTEAMAMLHGRRARDAAFLERYAGVPADAARHPANAATLRRGLLVLAAWVQVMTRFERAFYADPEGDLDAIWWDLVERYQDIPRPLRPVPDAWASKIHLAVAPCYYHNYLLGEILASQVEEWAERETGAASPADDPGAVGPLIAERLLRPGASLRWDRLVEHATGAPLGIDAFVRDASA